MSAGFLLKAFLNAINIQDKPGDDVKHGTDSMLSENTRVLERTRMDQTQHICGFPCLWCVQQSCHLHNCCFIHEWHLMVGVAHTILDW